MTRRTKAYLIVQVTPRGAADFTTTAPVADQVLEVEAFAGASVESSDGWERLPR